MIDIEYNIKYLDGINHHALNTNIISKLYEHRFVN
jgi:hypothetical protein